jgi:cytochrome P450
VPAGQLLQVIDPTTGAPLTLDQLKAELVIAALAGFETTSMALSWTLGALACHPDVMHKLHQVQLQRACNTTSTTQS